MRIPAPVARAALRGLVRPVLGPPVPLGVQRAWLSALQPGVGLPDGTTVERVLLGDRPAERVTAPGAQGAPVLLLHGGAFTTCTPRTHRAFAAALSAAAAAPVSVLDHRLSPEAPHPAAVDDALAALDALGPSARLVGDSAGGCLALMALLRRRDEGGPLPPSAALVSPLVDLTLASSAGWTGPDPLLRLDWVRQGVAAFTAGRDVPSPLQADLSGLPPLLVHVSSDERLRPEGEELARRVRAAGGSAELHVVEGAWHDVHLQAGLVATADRAVEHLGRWLR